MPDIDLSYPAWMLDLDEYQDAALKSVHDWYNQSKEQEFSIGGYAGTGKTTIIRVLLRDFVGALVAAFTGKAVHVLHQKGVAASTLHRLLYKCVGKDRETGRLLFEPKPPGTIRAPLIIVDEASMVSRELAQDLLAHGIPVLWVGDHGQLEPVGSGSVSLVKKPNVRLEHIHRQAESSGIISFAHHLRQDGKPYGWDGSSFTDVEVVEPEGFDLQRASDFDAVLCGTNEKRIEVNTLVRAHYDNPIPQPGEPLVVLRNNYEYGVFNGQVIFVVKAELAKPYFAITFLDSNGDEQEGRFLIEQFNNPEVQAKTSRSILLADYGYALTGHKSQGSEWEAVLVLEESVFADPRWRYTAATRASKHLVYVPCQNNMRARAKATGGAMARMLDRKKTDYVPKRKRKQSSGTRPGLAEKMRRRTKK